VRIFTVVKKLNLGYLTLSNVPLITKTLKVLHSRLWESHLVNVATCRLVGDKSQ